MSAQLSFDLAPKPVYRPLSPMQRDVLELLVAGWTSPIDALSGARSFSLSQRCGELARAGYPIEKRWLKTDSGKQVRQYRVKT